MSETRKVVARNRKARHDYEVVDHLEMGLVLTGSEIKSVRAGRVSLKGSYAAFDESGELWARNMTIAEYPQARDNHVPDRPRKLLAHAAQLRRLARSVREKGFTLVPLDLHLSGGRAKLEIGLCRGKRQHDRRREIAERDVERRIRSRMKEQTRSAD